MFQPAWLDAAWAELGVHEGRRTGSNPRILAFYRDAGHAEVDRDEVAWCAAFVGACLERSGIASTRSLAARSYLGWGEAIGEPRFGAVAVLERGADPALGHVGFLVGVAGDRIIVLGGNQRDAVSVAAFERARLIGLRWPSAPAARDMAHAGFDTALAHVLEMEGGWSNDPHDPGGPTNKGITLAVYADHLRRELRPDTIAGLTAELRQIPDRLVREIYLERYWAEAACDRLPAPIALMHFDAAVNHGVAGAARMLQQALEVPADGEIGPVTLAAAAAIAPDVLLGRYAEIRRQRYRSLPHFWRFGRGWLARVDRTLARATALNDVRPAADPASALPTSKGDNPMSDTSAQPEPARLPEPSKWWGESLTIWGALVTACATVLPVIGPLFGIDITSELARQLGEEIVRVVQAIAGLLGTAAVIWGRARATTRLARREMTINV